MPRFAFFFSFNYLSQPTFDASNFPLFFRRFLNSIIFNYCFIFSLYFANDEISFSKIRFFCQTATVISSNQMKRLQNRIRRKTHISKCVGSAVINRNNRKGERIYQLKYEQIKDWQFQTTTFGINERRTLSVLCAKIENQNINKVLNMTQSEVCFGLPTTRAIIPHNTSFVNSRN